MRFHLLACPNAQTTKEYSLCGFAALTIRFCNMMHDAGHEVFLYASEENEARCTELVTTITKQEQKTLMCGVPYQSVWFDPKCRLVWDISGCRAIAAIDARKAPGDFILSIGGTAHKPIFDWHSDLLGVEYSIGYTGTFAPNRVFESHAHRAFIQGLYSIQNSRGNFFDEVIPVVFDYPQFEQRVPDDYFLYVGRLTEQKGVLLACEVAKAAGVKLKVIGHGDTSLVQHGAEYLGALPQDERNDVMSRARAVFCPTLYIEPFNCVAVEAQLYGVPVISTPWGGFLETIEHGVTGFRCTMFREFVAACTKVNRLDRVATRIRALSLYTVPAIYPQYERYFQRVSELSGKGFYAP
jgi:glycosyltransferase involved in cell wall biosynthesis